MKILVTTHQAFLAVDTETKQVKKIQSLEGTNNAFYGVHFSGKNVFLGCRFPLSKTGNVQILDYSLENQETLQPRTRCALPGMHQILNVRGKIFAVATQRNGCGVYNLKTKTWRMWYPDRRWPDINKYHFNSLYFNKNKLYVMAMRGSDQDSEQSEVFVFNHSTFKLERKFSLGSGSHCLWEMDDKFYTLSSRNCSVESEDGRVIDLEPGFWPRGAVVLPEEDRIFIGASPVTSRGARNSSLSKLWVYDMDWNFIEDIRLGHHGNVYDVRAPGYKDLCSPTIKGRKVKI